MFFIIFSFTIGTKPKKVEAFLGIGDIVIDFANLVQNTISAIAEPVVAFGTSPISAASDVVQVGKETVGDSMANFAAKTMLRQITAQTVNWINSGFQGNPAYVTNPDKFFLGVADRTAAQFLNQGGALDALCSPFQSKIRLALVKNYLQEAQPPNCTLTGIVKNYEGFTKDFSQGGWDAWFEVTTKEENNPYGAYLKAKDQLEIQINSSQGKYQNQLNQGRGFLSFERCARRGNVARQRLGTQSSPVCVDYDFENNQCRKYSKPEKEADVEVVDENVCTQKETVTPGSVIQGQLEKALGSSVSQLEVADEINEVIGALMVQVFQKAIGGITSGLRGLSESGSGSNDNSRSLLEQLQNQNPADPNSAGAEDLKFIEDAKKRADESIKYSETDDVLGEERKQRIEDQVNDQFQYYQNRYNNQPDQSGMNPDPNTTP